MLLPALNKARDTAKAATCTNNLKQMGLAQAGYSADYDEWIVPGGAPAASGNGYWYNLLSGYQDVTKGYGTSYYGNDYTKGTFVCPSESSSFGSCSALKFQYTHYAMNSCVSGNCANWGNYRTAGNQDFYWLRKTSCVTQASVCMLFMDSWRRNSATASKYHYSAFRHGQPEPRAPESGNPSVDPKTANCKGKTQVCFFDGHAEGQTYSEVSFKQGFITK